jgi:hypothetical protein
MMGKISVFGLLALLNSAKVEAVPPRWRVAITSLGYRVRAAWAAAAADLSLLQRRPES